MIQVLVAGGGPAGLAAAVASARRGCETMLLERYGFLGGMATAGLVNPFMTQSPKGVPLVAGVFLEILDRLSAKTVSAQRQEPNDWGVTFEAETFKVVADEICREAGVQVRLHTLLTGARARANHITSIITESKTGRETWRARIYIDATGDADLAFRAGVPCEVGRKQDNLTQPMTLNFKMAKVAVAQMPSRAEINRLYDAAKAAGRVHCPREDVLFFYTLQPDVVHFNTTRVIGKSGLDAADLTAAEIEARRQTQELAHFFISNVPGFEQAYLQQTGTQIGIRESRRIRGEYILTEDAVLNAKKFPDGIARCAYPIDIHNPNGAGTELRGVPEGDYYEIPYRCLLPLEIDNLLVAGRCVSATHEAQASLRVMPQCFAMGEAAGLAAALAVQQSILPREVKVAELRRALNLGRE